MSSEGGGTVRLHPPKYSPSPPTHPSEARVWSGKERATRPVGPELRRHSDRRGGSGGSASMGVTSGDTVMNASCVKT